MTSAFESFLLRLWDRSCGSEVEDDQIAVNDTQRKRPRDADKAQVLTPLQEPDEGDAAKMQQLLVDVPLQPIGVEHSLYHVLIPAFTTALKAARNVWLAKQAAKEKEECVNETGGTGNTTPGEQDGRPDDHIAIAPTQGQWNTGTSKRSVVEAERELSERRMQLELAQQKVRTLLTTLLHYKSRVATTSSTTEDV
ncbi:hypothetical protein ERJ75_001751400 [Trypanosoma vivax]|nr:hypothetical protein ERJ75_001751400 [Trypanosoma vivax]